VTPDPRLAVVPDTHGHAKGEHKPFAEERPIPYTARMLFLWFYHACRRGSPRYLMVADHMNYLTFEDPAAVNLVRRALKLAQAGDLYGAAETAGVDVGHAAVVSEGLRKGMRYSIGAEVDNDPRSRPDAQNIVDAMRADGMIRSVHFLPIAHPQYGESWMWPFDNEEFKEFYEVVGTERVWELYMATLLEAIEKLPGHIVGHFYVPAIFGHWPDDATLETYEDRLLDACLERGFAVEINSRYLYKHYAADEAQLEKFRSVHLRLMRKAKEKGVLIATGSDAHSPKDQGGAFDVILALLDEAEINEIAFPINGRLARVALRATEELMRQQSAAQSAAGSFRDANGAGSNGAFTGDGSHLGAEEAESETAAVQPAAVPAEGSPVAGVRPRPKRRPRTAAPATHPEAEALEPGESAHEPGAPAPAAEPVAATPVVADAESSPPKPPAPKRAARPPKAAKAESPSETPVVAAATVPAAVPAPAKAAVVEKRAAAKPPAAKPAGAKPATAKPPSAKPPSAKPLSAKPAATKPAATKAPATKAPATKAPAAKSAAAVKPSAAKPSPKKAASKAPDAKKSPGVKKAAPKKAAPKKAAAARAPAPAAKRASGAKKAAPPKRSAKPAKRAAAKRPAVKKTVAKKSVVKKSPAKKKSSRARR
jgi:HisJ family histidinol phosphate phosphatase